MKVELLNLNGEKVKDLTGISVDNYVLLDTGAVRKMVDAIGGIPMNVPFDMDYDDNEQNLHIKLKKGQQILDGNKADDVLNPRSKLLQINVFSTDSIVGKGSSGKYGFGALTYNNGTDVVLNFPSKFTVCFQAKFVDKGFEDTAFGNLISVVFVLLSILYTNLGIHT